MNPSPEQFAEEISALMDYFATRKLSFSTACAVMGTVIASAMLYSDRKAARYWTRDLKKNGSKRKELM